MFIQEITLEISHDLDMDLIVDEFNWLMAAYHKNGQLLNGAQTQFLSGRKIISLPYTLERDSLNKKFNNKAVNNQLSRLEKLCQAKLNFRTVGTDYSTHNSACSCQTHSMFYLTSFGFSRDSAVLCGSCRLTVPLYKLPKTSGDTYEDIINWQISTMICDGLETINLKNDNIPSLPNNYLLAFDKMGFKVCSRIEELTGVKTRLFQKLGKEKKSTTQREEQTS